MHKKKMAPAFVLLLILLACTAPAEIRLLGEDDWQRVRAEARGTVLVVNVWATWCAPCVEEFPDLTAVAEELDPDLYQFIAVSLDYPDEVESKVRPFVEKMAPRFPVFVQNFASEAAFIDTMSAEWRGAVPATFVYNPDGTLLATHVGKLDKSGFRDLITNRQQDTN